MQREWQAAIGSAGSIRPPPAGTLGPLHPVPGPPSSSHSGPLKKRVGGEGGPQGLRAGHECPEPRTCGKGGGAPYLEQPDEGAYGAANEQMNECCLF